MIAADPKDNELKFSLSKFYEELKQPAKAEAVLQGVISEQNLDPAGLTARDRLAALRVQSNDVAGAQKLFSELSEMFPNQLEAVVLDGSTPRLVLAEKTSENKGTPLFVRLCGAQGCQRVITFSGQRVLLNGESYEVLMDARGRVIVSGDHFVWLSGDGAPVHRGYRIEATQLEGAL